MSVLQAILEADAIIAGAPGRQGGMCGEMRLFLDTWAKHQTEQKVGFGALKVCLCHLSIQCRFMPGVVKRQESDACLFAVAGGLQLLVCCLVCIVAASMPAPYHMTDT